MDAVAALAPGSGLITAACTALGLSRASLHRRQAFRRQPLAAVRPRPTPLRALVANERQVVLDLLREPRFVDLAPAEVYASLLDQGVYLCSIRTMYRVLAEHDEVCERRRQLRRPVYQKPELLAEGPNQVWSWHNEVDGAREMELLLSLCHHRYFQPQDRRLVHRRC
jgi:putative transposase